MVLDKQVNDNTLETVYSARIAHLFVRAFERIWSVKNHLQMHDDRVKNMFFPVIHAGVAYSPRLREQTIILIETHLRFGL